MASSVAVLAASARDGRWLVEGLGVGNAVVVTPQSLHRVRGLTLSAVVESPGFNSLPDAVQAQAREAVAPCLATTGGQWLSVAPVH